MHTMSYAKLPYRKVESSLTHMPEGVIGSSSGGGIWEAESDLGFDLTNESKFNNGKVFHACFMGDP